MVEVPPPAHTDIGAPPDMLASHKDDKSTFKDLCTNRIAVCSTLYRSVEVDIKSALDDDPRATACIRLRLLGEVWGFFTQLVRGLGPDNVLMTLGDTGSFAMYDFST